MRRRTPPGKSPTSCQVFSERVAEHTDIVVALARSALDSDIVRRAASRRHWKETYVATTISDRVLEGFIDLVFEDEDGLVVVDYKTDSVPSAALDRRTAFCRPQVAAYVASLAAATGQPVARAVLLFLSPGGAVERTVDDLGDAVGQLRNQIAADRTPSYAAGLSCCSIRSAIHTLMTA